MNGRRIISRLCLSGLFLSLLITSTYGRHLVGGDLTYQCLGKDAQGRNAYRVFLNIYRDCLPNGQFITNTPFDKVAELYIFDGTTRLIRQTINISLQDSVILSITSQDSCAPPPTNLCYTTASYVTTIYLPDNTGGYYLSWGRCCRNESIVNLRDPGNQGMVLPAFIPSTSLCNNSPSFLNRAPTFICANDNFSFDQSAIDVDGDSLVYELTLPFTAGSKSDPFPTPTPPPYQPVTWGQGYSNNNIMDGDPALAINPRTGLLTVRPRQIGQYVFSVSVFEYRNGVLLSEVKRDIQINVVNCPINFPPDIIRPVVAERIGDTLVFVKGQENCFSFRIEDVNGIGVDPDILKFSGSGSVFEPPYNAVFDASSGLSPQNISICWAPSCIEQPLADDKIIISATDNNDCPGPNITYDTLVVKLVDGIVVAPEILCASQTADGDVIVSWASFAPGEDQNFVELSLFRTNGGTPELIGTIDDSEIASFQDRTVDLNTGETYCYFLVLEKDCQGPILSEPGDPVCAEQSLPSDICAVSALPQNSGLSISWSPSFLANFESYQVYRSEREQEFTLLAEFTDPTTTSYADSSAQPNGSYCYLIRVLDACGIELESEVDCSMPLQLAEANFELELNWETYTGWKGGVREYEIWRQLPDGAYDFLASVPGGLSRYEDRAINNNQPTYCYQIRAIPMTLECAEEALSWETCFDFGPLLYVPSAFSPNGDGRNDFFEVKGAFVPQVEMTIFNRWGQAIFTTNSLEQPWDGYAKGQAVPEGVYVYRLRLTTIEGQVLARNGSITVIR